MKKLFFIFCVFLIFTSSCSIEKRHYLPGYYVHKTKDINTINNNFRGITVTPLIKEKEDAPLEISLLKKAALASGPIKGDAKYSLKRESFQVFPQNKPLTDTNDSITERNESERLLDNPTPEKKIPASAIVSLVFGLLSALWALLSLSSALAGFWILVGFFGLLVILFAILSTGFGIGSAIQISLSKEKYKGIGMAIAGLILGIAALITFVIVYSTTF